MTLRILRFDTAGDTTTLELGRVDVMRVGTLSLGQARYEPGWRWSQHVGAAIGQRFCRASHVGIVIAGRNRIEMEDGRTVDITAGDMFDIGPGHDSWVIGDEPYVSLHLAGVEEYTSATGAAADGSPT